MNCTQQPEEDSDVVIVKINKLRPPPRTPPPRPISVDLGEDVLSRAATPPPPGLYRPPLLAKFPYQFPPQLLPRFSPQLPAQVSPQFPQYPQFPQLPPQPPQSPRKCPPQVPFWPLPGLPPPPPRPHSVTVDKVNFHRPTFHPEDFTALNGEQKKWNLLNLPNILYVLRPGSEHANSRTPVRMTKYTIFGKRVRDFTVLPKQISSGVEAWRLEAWMRLDSRITEQDIVDRVNPKFREYLPPAYIEYRRKFFREHFHLACWDAQEEIDGLADELRKIGIDPARNTTRGLTPGLIDPAKGEAGGRVLLPCIQVCLVVGGGSNQPIPTSVAIQEQLEWREEYRQHRAMARAACEPLMTYPFPQPFVHPRVPNAAQYYPPSAQYIAPYPISYSGGKRKSMEPVRQEQPLPYYKRQKATADDQEDGANPTRYPFLPNELAPHNGLAPRRPPFERDTARHTLSLEDYLRRNQLTYDEFLYSRYADEIPELYPVNLRLKIE
ncbi:hypothetical protein BDV59DRAFT_204660 [Aspergillus ambiguus]|uniref:uncharacterized protein n=1 Tax=Aspergillus ambiguus TaxID=176160 RepID=UPI003CCCA2A0